LVELLTVVAIVAVLATLLLTSLHSAQRRSRQSRCLGNLHQISLALNMYLDDFDRRASELPTLVKTRYLPSPQALLCPEDRTGNWGGMVNGSGLVILAGGANNFELSSPGAAGLPSPPTIPEVPTPFSYMHPLWWDDPTWGRLLKLGSQAGLAACELHGLGRPGEPLPSIHDYQGLVLRAQRDGAVVRRKVFWGDPPQGFPPPTSAAPSAADTVVTSTSRPAMASPPGEVAWPLFADETPAP